MIIQSDPMTSSFYFNILLNELKETLKRSREMMMTRMMAVVMIMIITTVIV